MSGSAMKVDVTVINLLADKCKSPALKRQLEGIASEKPVAALIGQAIADNFAQGGPGWKPLKIRDGLPLQKSGDLKRSATTPGAPGNIYKTDGTVITWGTNLIYAGIHQRGGTIKAKNGK